MHGAEQFAVPHAFKWHDRFYFTIANRLYCRKASAIIAMTHLGSKDIVKYMGPDPKKIRVIHESYNEQCRILEKQSTDLVKKKYSLPDQFILFVGGINPLKNFGNLLRAYHEIQKHLPHKMVAVGFKRWKFDQDLRTDHIHFPNKTIVLLSGTLVFWSKTLCPVL